MKLTSLIAIAVLGLSACTNYQAPTANCFDQDTVTRSSNSLNFFPASRDRHSTSTAPVSDCAFVTLGGPTNTTDP